jgi:hypothetical protein
MLLLRWVLLRFFFGVGVVWCRRLIVFLVGGFPEVWSQVCGGAVFAAAIEECTWSVEVSLVSLFA